MKRSFPQFAAVVLVLVACQSQGQKPAAKVASDDVTAQDYVMPKLPQARVTLVDAFGGKHVVDVEVAATRDQRTRGLMWRTELAEGKGMLFVFPNESQLSFWMKNTLIPLDMIFIRSDLSIAGIVEKAEPRTLVSRAPGRQQSMYVLEVPSGWSERAGLKTGLKVAIDGLRGLVPEP